MIKVELAKIHSSAEEGLVYEYDSTIPYSKHLETLESMGLIADNTTKYAMKDEHEAFAVCGILEDLVKLVPYIDWEITPIGTWEDYCNFSTLICSDYFDDLVTRFNYKLNYSEFARDYSKGRFMYIDSESAFGSAFNSGCKEIITWREWDNELRGIAF